MCDNLTAAANVFLGREIKRRIGVLKILDFPAMYTRVGEIFQELKSETRPGISSSRCREDSDRLSPSLAPASRMHGSY